MRTKNEFTTMYLGSFRTASKSIVRGQKAHYHSYSLTEKTKCRRMCDRKQIGVMLCDHVERKTS